MRPTLSLIRREFTAYFLSPIAYVVLTVFLLVTGFLYCQTVEFVTERGRRGVAYRMGVVPMPLGFVGRGFLIAVVGAAIAAVSGYLHCKYDTQHIVTLSSGIDPWPVLTSYIGVVTAGVMFLSLGLFVSSLVRGQMIAA